MGEPAPLTARGGAGFDIRRIALLAGVASVITFAVFFFLFRGCATGTSRGQSGYTVIYSNLELKDAANAIARLKELAIPYEIRDEGRAVAVPKQRADEARLGLAEKNLPAGGAVGWEIFDESRLGATDFDRRIQLIRAISGELSRTIRRIQAVEDARVQIVLPETKLFAESTPPVTASVLLRLKPGAALTRAKVNGIVHLVSSSVENLQTENVTVIDNTGRILTARELRLGGELIAVGLEEPLKAEKVAEAQQEIAVVAAEEQRIIRSDEKSVPPPPPPPAYPEAKEIAPAKEKVATREAVAAVVKPPALTREERILLVVQAKKELEQDLAGKAQEILNRFYPLNSAIVKVDLDLENGGKTFSKEELKINKLTSIILVDNRVDLSAQLKQATYKAVAAAIGYNRGRGDRIIMQRVPFHLATPPPEVVKGQVEQALPPRERGKLPEIPLSWLRNILWLVGTIAGGLLFLFLVRLVRNRPRKATVRVLPEKERPAERAPAPPPQSREKANTLETIKNAVERNPERIAELLKGWLTE